MTETAVAERSPTEALPELNQRMFVHEYIVDFDAQEAGIRCGYTHKTATAFAKKCLASKPVQEAIAYELEQRRKRLHITADRIVEEYAKVAFAEYGDYADWNAGTVVIKAKNQIPRSKRAAIQSITETATPQSTTMSLKLHDKLKALDALARFLGMNNDKTTVEHNVNVVDQIIAARERVIEARKQIPTVTDADASYVVNDAPENDDG